MKLAGKRICFLGDSITQGVGASSVETCYVSLFATKNPEAVVYNHGISGTRIAPQHLPSAHDLITGDFCARLEETASHADIICVFGGTNDHGHGNAPMGKLGDTTPETFYGALYTLTAGLIEKAPTARIVFFTPLHKEDEHRAAVRGDGAWKLCDYAKAIRENAEFFSCPVLDPWKVSGIQPRLPVSRAQFMPDGLHPNDAGHERLCKIINAFLTNLG